MTFDPVRQYLNELNDQMQRDDIDPVKILEKHGQVLSEILQYGDDARELLWGCYKKAGLLEEIQKMRENDTSYFQTTPSSGEEFRCVYGITDEEHEKTLEILRVVGIIKPGSKK